MNLTKSTLLAAAFALMAGQASAAIIGQLGVLQDTANGGINPNTGLAWEVGDTYRLAFVTSTTRDATSADINDYNAFVQGVAAASTTYANLGDATWKAMASTAATSANANTGTASGAAGADGTPWMLMDGLTYLAEDSEDFWDGPRLRFAAGVSPNGQNMYYSPYLDENNVEDTSGTFGPNVATGSLESGAAEGANRVLGNTEADPAKVTHGNTRPNTPGRVIRRFNGNASSQWKFYALSEELTVVPEPSTLALLGLGGLMIARRRRG